MTEKSEHSQESPKRQRFIYKAGTVALSAALIGFIPAHNYIEQTLPENAFNDEYTSKGKCLDDTFYEADGSIPSKILIDGSLIRVMASTPAELPKPTLSFTFTNQGSFFDRDYHFEPDDKITRETLETYGC